MIKSHFHSACLLGRNGRHAIHAFKKALGIKLQQLVITSGYYPIVIRECPINQLAGKDNSALAAHNKPNLAG